MVFQTKSTVNSLLVCLLLLFSCGKENVLPVVSIDAKAIPVLHTEDVTTLISDSGIIRVKWEAKVWDRFADSIRPYQYFPEKIYVERFDTLFNPVGFIKADTAYFYEPENLWKLIGNVVAKNLEGTVFETSELFWNRQANPNSRRAIYTDKETKVTDVQGRINIGRNGFEANQELTYFLFLSTNMELEIDDE